MQDIGAIRKDWEEPTNLQREFNCWEGRDMSGRLLKKMTEAILILIFAL